CHVSITVYRDLLFCIVNRKIAYLKGSLMTSQKEYLQQTDAQLGTDSYGLTRRHFGGLMLGAGLSLAGISQSHNAWAETTKAAEPKKGGSVRIALNSQGANDTFDGARALNPGDFIRCASIYSYLTRMDADG